MKTPNNLKKNLKIALYSFLGLFAIVSMICFWGLKPLLSKRIQEATLSATDGLYNVGFKKIEYEIFSGTARIVNATWEADTTLFDLLKKKKKLPNNIYKGKVNNIRLTGLRPWTIIFSKKLSIASIEIVNPNVEIIHENQPYNSFKTGKTPYQIISKFIESFSVGKISCQNINFAYTDLSTSEKINTNRIENLDLEMSNLLIDSVSHKDKDRFYYSKACFFRLKKMRLPSEDSLNVLTINDVLFSSKNKELTIRKIVNSPRYKALEYGNRSGGQDRVESIVENVKLTKINLEKLFEEKKMYAQNLWISKGKLEVFADTRPFKENIKANYKPFPHEAFRKMDIKFMVDTVHINQLKITYSEYNPDTDLVGHVHFNKIKGIALNLTNDTIPLQKNPHCLFHLNTEFMNKTSVDVNFDFNIASLNGDFKCDGKVAKMSAIDLNQVTNALAMAKAQDGLLDSFSFTMSGNKKGIKGSVKMLYHDLKVIMLQDKNQDKVLKKKIIMSIVANNFVIKNANPLRNKPVRVIAIDYHRNPSKGFFFTLWRFLLVGIKETVM